MSLNTRIAATALATAAGLLAGPVQATCSGEPMLASICITAANFCPRGYADANGQILAISQNAALFSLLGTQYGGNGQTTFALPNLQGRVPVGVGQGTGLAPIQQGEVAGAESVQLSVAQLPAHSHTAQLKGTASNGTVDSPSGAVPARLPRSNNYGTGTADANMGASAISVGTTGSGQPVAIRNPYLGLRYCIALQGIYPSRD